jgi:hypothetical protein
MSEPQIEIALDGDRQRYRPQQLLSGEFRLEHVAPTDVAALEISVIWHTQGKGDEDLAVHYFKRIDVAAGEYLDTRQPVRFSTLLPQSPLSYEGVIVKIRWCVRLRLYLANNRELVEERRFVLGDIPSARAVLPSSSAAP